MPNIVKEKKTVQLNGIRCPADIVEYMDKKIEENVFSSRSHAVIRLLRIGMEVEKDRAKIVHSYETGFSLSPKKEKE